MNMIMKECESRAVCGGSPIYLVNHVNPVKFFFFTKQTYKRSVECGAK